ncbi:MAG: hypothetical protein U9Q63_01300 [Patescibacteria group bacterium]|nr:hypothetical protein [Patescibacteria group bacterium]
MRFLLFSLLFLSLLVKPAQAIIDPRLTTNNRFGIHALDLNDLDAAANLVNSTGGQWGYVTLVIRQNDLNHDKWQTILDKCRDLKLIPIIRLATIPINDYWATPNLNHISTWVNFLNNLNWVIQNRYIVLFNEPNHAKEWGNNINPKEYTKIVKSFHQALKQASPDYFILPAGFDTAAPNSVNTMTATDYWSKMYQSDPEIFKLFDGWNSHSYPNPGFSGPVTGSGFGTLTSYQTEINYLKFFNLPSDLPIFITETGWIHKDGKILGASTENLALSKFYSSAFESIWTQPNLIAITPFILNFPQPPFDQFAWQKPNSNEFYPHYHAVKNLSKIKGQPAQVYSNQLINHTIPDKLTESSSYQVSVTFKNTGQSIWDQKNTSLNISTNLPQKSFLVTSSPITKPFSSATFTITINTPPQPQEVLVKIQLKNSLELFGQAIEKTIKIIPPPNIIVKATRLLKSNPNPIDYRLLIYDQNQSLVKQEIIYLKNSISQPIKLYDLIPQTEYRFVLLKPFYLPRQVKTNLNPTQTIIKFKTLLPFDLNQDGHFSIKDIIFSLTHPLTLPRLFK